MPEFGRSSLRTVAALANVAGASPAFATWIFQLKLLPTAVVPLTSSVLVAVS
jgi:hypothetical protein